MLRHLHWRLSILLAAAAAAAAAADPLPIVLDTDIGDDFDDSWALALALSRPDKWDVRLILTSCKNTTKRAAIVAKYLTRWNRTDIPIGIGRRTRAEHDDYSVKLGPWADDLDLAAYNQSGGGPGLVHADGVAAVAALVHASRPGTITYVGIAPMANVRDLAVRFPTAILTVRKIYAMVGAVDFCYGRRPFINGTCVEYNAAEDLNATRVMWRQPWSVTITPLDTCFIRMTGAPWARILAANSSSRLWATRPSLVPTLLETLTMWGGEQNYGPNAPASDVLYDAVALYLSSDESLFRMSRGMLLSLTEQGATVRTGDPVAGKGKALDVALRWDGTGNVTVLDRLSRWIIAGPSAVVHRQQH